MSQDMRGENSRLSVELKCPPAWKYGIKTSLGEKANSKRKTKGAGAAHKNRENRLKKPMELMANTECSTL
eukprot:6192391-Pleurochrysis_carterae.AAC.1